MRLGTCKVDVYSLKALRTQSNGMFLTWVLKDNSQVTKAPIRWQDLVPAYTSFMNDSSLQSPLEQKGWWLDIAGNDKGSHELKNIFHCPSLLRALGMLRKVPCFHQDSRKYLEGWGKGMQNVSFFCCLGVLFFLNHC